ncbi:MAG: hypothetical protein K2X73_15250 [Sphingomonas sp.]|uniref:hypothetical protein n=1 Tax=Sphingomonas sp. TaxID=28214 RepID=UPI0025F810CB|nr:hypothetical protein [Sphingomonas sp.]MBX9883307.1 hypothetical protein [Sphingomonas sp.]
MHHHDCAHDCDCPGDCSGGCADSCHFAALTCPATPAISSATFPRPLWMTALSIPLLSTALPLPAAPPDLA